MLNRRGFLGGLLAAPAIIRTPGLLMPVKAPLLAAIPAEFAVVSLPPAANGEFYHFHNTSAKPIQLYGHGLLRPDGHAILVRHNGVWVREPTSVLA